MIQRLRIILLTLAAAVSLSNCGSGNSSLPVASTNEEPETFIKGIVLNDAVENDLYSINLQEYLSDNDVTSFEFSLDDSPAWLTLNADNILSGTPTEADIGDHSWRVTVVGNSDDDSDVIDEFANESVIESSEMNAVESLSDNNTNTISFNLTVLSSEAGQLVALNTLTVPKTYDLNGLETDLTSDLIPGEIESFYYDGLDFEGNATRVYAYIGIPEGVEEPIPAVVLVHGGGGTAFSAWVQLWNDRGYAAISMAVEGQTDESDLINGGYVEHQWAGPSRDGIYGDSDQTFTDQWMYHATADAILANSLLRSLPEIDNDAIGIMGISWGGVITSTVMGIDQRFAFAIPTYGCGHLYDQGNQYGRGLDDDILYKTVWDPVLRMDDVTMPSMWLSWSDDSNFSMDSCAATYFKGPDDYMVSYIPDMGHGHVAGWKVEESYTFADSIINEGNIWFTQTTLTQDDNTVAMTFISTKKIIKQSLRYTTGTGFTGDVEWLDAKADLVNIGDGYYEVTATLPDSTTGWYFSLSDGSVYASSDYQENIQLTLTPNEQLNIAYPVGEEIVSNTVEVLFSGPTNVEVVSVKLVDESHIGAFSIAINDVDLLNVSEQSPFVISDPTSPEVLTVSLNNLVAKLAAGEQASATLMITWQALDGSLTCIALPIRVDPSAG